MQRLLGALEAFCQSNGLTVNVDKTKMMDLGIDVPATWSICFESRLQASWKSYYILENKCNQSYSWMGSETNVI